MSLHGDIRVNGYLLGEWSAQRMSNVDDAVLDPDTVSEYRCVVTTRDIDKEFYVNHRYGDGPVVLATKVLAGAGHQGARPRRLGVEPPEFDRIERGDGS